MELRKYTLTLKADSGKFNISTTACSEQKAKEIIMRDQCCPESAIKKVKTGKVVYKGL